MFKLVATFLFAVVRAKLSELGRETYNTLTIDAGNPSDLVAVNIIS